MQYQARLGSRKTNLGIPKAIERDDVKEKTENHAKHRNFLSAKIPDTPIPYPVLYAHKYVPIPLHNNTQRLPKTDLTLYQVRRI